MNIGDFKNFLSIIILLLVCVGYIQPKFSAVVMKNVRYPLCQLICIDGTVPELPNINDGDLFAYV